MELPKDIQNELWDWCRTNNITNVDQFILNMVKQGFNIEKYGNSPIVPNTIEKEVIKEIEKIVEVPVEKIVERVVEVPVEKIVEKIISDDKQVQELLIKISSLEEQLKQEKIKTSTSGLDKLYQKIENLEALLEIERNRNKFKKTDENPFGDKPKSAINWVHTENKNRDLYGE